MSLEDELYEAKELLLERILESPDVEVKSWCLAPEFPYAASGIEFFVGNHSVQLQQEFSIFRGDYLTIDGRKLSREVSAKVKAAIQRINEKRQRNELLNLRCRAQEVAKISEKKGK